MMELMAKVPAEERTPYTIVAFQECERMNTLTNEMKRSLKELDLGLKVSVWWKMYINNVGSCIAVHISHNSHNMGQCALISYRGYFVIIAGVSVPGRADDLGGHGGAE